ncbi:GntR family transcriptional regulator [Pseudonocardia sp. MH-G8]|uniref:GntR family transcriptional regulator n=1 Tax=Pseudonocardia sp. MH-G8 TaxID=1854588 RepID=UPI000BA011FF|nr:GntR family transcriptional regulator [Pseudonocardia sp. MH-G8]OZM77312.1 GntR family transcriptional regulator [Pseudonocardia sp. MH-G8]
MPGLRPLELARGALDPESVPRYERVAEQLWEELRAGGARSGDRLPSERTLTERYEVSRVTLRSALSLLAERGAVQAAPSRGWFVAGEVATATATSHVEGFADYARKHRIPISSEVLLSRVRPCTVREAQRLRLAPGADLFEMRRLRSLNGMVVVLEHNRLPLALCPALADTDFTQASLYATLLTADPPQIPRRAEYAVEARPPNREERRLLDLEGTSVPVLMARQLTNSQHGHPLEITDQAYRGDRYQFRASIT